MKKKKNNIARIEEIINSDRLAVTDEFYKLLSQDLEKLLRDYFDFNGSPRVEITKNGSVYAVDISLVVSKLFRFNKLPE